MHNMSLYDKLSGAVRGGALGDALGLPVETYTYKKIKKQFGAIDGFEQIKHNRFASKAAGKGEFPGDLNDVGYISDDTILTLAGLQSLINKKKIDLLDLFNEHILFVQKFGKRGFGKGTLAALEKIQTGIDPQVAGTPNRGNGVMMKQLPFAFHFVTEKTPLDKMDETIATIARCTHTKPIAILTAIIQNRLLVHLFKQDPDTPLDRDILLAEYKNLAKRLEAQSWYTQNADDPWLVSDILEKLETQWHLIQQGTPYKFEKLLKTYTVTGPQKQVRRGFHVASTFGYVWGIFLQKQNRNGLLDAINIGQDTDTQAAIIGNMIGAYKGEFYDKTLLRSLKSKDEIFTVLQAVKTSIK